MTLANDKSIRIVQSLIGKEIVSVGRYVPADDEYETLVLYLDDGRRIDIKAIGYDWGQLEITESHLTDLSNVKEGEALADRSHLSEVDRWVR